jgi:hypothetical protein
MQPLVSGDDCGEKHFTAQRLAFKVHHRSAELVEHHPCCLVTSQTELTLQKKGRDATLIGGHQVIRYAAQNQMVSGNFVS